MTTKQAVLGMQAAGEFQGSVLWWSLDEATVPAKDFCDRWVAAGLPKDVLPQDRSPHRNLTEAAAAVMSRHDDYVVDVIEGRGPHRSKTKLSIMRADRQPQNDRAIHTQECSITLDTSNGNIWTQSTLGNMEHPIATEIREEFDKLEGVFTDAEIRRSITSLMRRLCAVSLRKSGGVYWVAPQHSPTVEALAGVIKETGRSEVDMLALFATGVTTATVRRAANRNMLEEVDALKAEVEKFKQEAPRSGVLARRLTEAADLRAKANLYREILALDVSEIEAGLAALEATVDLLLTTPSTATVAA